MNVGDFDYTLPLERIAERSVEPRDHARLLMLDRRSGNLADHHVYDLPSLLHPGDLLVMNDTRVFKARLHGHIGARTLEVFLLHTDEENWQALLRPGKHAHVGDTIAFDEQISAHLLEKFDDGTVRLRFNVTHETLLSWTDTHGQIPSPPYVQQVVDEASYQTIYAKHTGSVAAPTAGFHFTDGLLASLEARGVQRAFVTLHVGLGTFRPMKTETLEEHTMHAEWGHVPQATVDAIQQTRARGGRVIVVGTTALRALESMAQGGALGEWSGWTSIFITPGFLFRVADALITNFHLPKSTLIVLVSAFAGREHVLRAYQHAIDHKYRFYSFGDAMFIA